MPMKWVEKLKSLPVPQALATLNSKHGELTVHLNAELSAKIDKLQSAVDDVVLQLKPDPSEYVSSEALKVSYITPDDVVAGPGLSIIEPDDDGEGLVKIGLDPDFLHECSTVSQQVQVLGEQVLALKSGLSKPDQSVLGGGTVDWSQIYAGAGNQALPDALATKMFAGSPTFSTPVTIEQAFKILKSLGLKSIVSTHGKGLLIMHPSMYGSFLKKMWDDV